MSKKIANHVDIINAEKSHQFSYDPSKEETDLFLKNYENEKIVMHYVKMGDLDGLQSYWTSRLFHIHLGYASGELRNERNYAIYVTTIVSRAAIDGGLDVAVAYSLSNRYHAQIETIDDANQLIKFVGHIITTFCEQVRYHKISAYTSPYIDKTIRMIQRNINKKISTRDIAEALNISESHLCSLFKKEVGKTVMNVIIERKIEEAKLILQMPDTSISDVSNYLQFSSQSYFQNTFKRITGLTPNAYRHQFR